MKEYYSSVEKVKYQEVGHVRKMEEMLSMYKLSEITVTSSKHESKLPRPRHKS